MADDVPPFLQALELDAEADERAIRRAYAKRLKRIDPETDPEGFQALREVFEAALEWVAQPKGQRLVRVTRHDGGASAPAPRAPVARPAPPASADTASGIEMPARSTGSFSWTMDDAKGATAAPATSSAPAPREAEPAPTPAPRPVLFPVPEPTPAPAREAQPADERASPQATPPPPRRKPVDAPAIPAEAHRAPAARPPRIATPAPERRPPGAPRLPSQPLSIALQQDPADIVYADFADRFERTASDEADVARLLREALADERLLNLEARTRFEGNVAALLAGGWRPGHESLFQPACDVFEWESDRRRLEIFGGTGEILDAAVRERLIFFAQPAVVFEAQKSLIRRLRKERPSNARELAPEMARLGLLMQRFPSWMRVMTRKEVVQHWIDTWNELSDGERAAARGLAAPEPEFARVSAPAPARATARPATRAAVQAARAPTRPAPLPPVQPYVKTTRSFWGGSEGSGSTRWVIAACIAGFVRFFGSMGSPSHHAPAQPPMPSGESVTFPAEPPPTQAQSIRALAGQGQQAIPDYSSPSVDGPGANPIDAARQQQRQDATARRQQQLDERYQEILRSRQAKQATRTGTQGDEPGLEPVSGQ